MTLDEAITMVKAKLKCIELSTTGRYELCNRECKELIENRLGVGDFAKKYGCKKGDVYNGKTKYGIYTEKVSPSKGK